MDVHSNPGPSTWSDISLCHANIRSIRRCEEKLDHIKCQLSDNYDIITLSETWLNNEIDNASLNLIGFQVPLRKDRFTNEGYGGVLAWVSIRLAVKRRLDFELNDLEAMWLEIRSHNNKFLLCIIYRPPNSTTLFWDRLQESFDLAMDSNIPYIMIIGDLNADPTTLEGRKLALFAESNFLTQHITEPTRITQTSKTIVDQCLSNFPHIVNNPRVQQPVSTNDHSTIGLDLLFRHKKSKSYKRTMWQFDQCDINKLHNKITNADFDKHYDANTPEMVFENWSLHFKEIISSSIPNKEVTVRQCDKPWFNGYLRRLLRKKNRIHCKAKTENSNIRWTQFRETRNHYFNEVKRLKSEFEQNKQLMLVNEGLRNPKKWWSVLNSFLGKDNTQSIPPIQVGDNIISDDKEKADCFNQHFTQASKLDDSNSEIPPFEVQTNSFLNNINITEQDVADQLQNLDCNKAYGPDGISPKFLKLCVPVIVYPLTKLYKYSMDMCYFPIIWKSANVLPLFKKDEDYLRTNYRPVSLLSCLGKILEKIVFKYVYNHFRDNFLLTVWQSGFLIGHSTVTQLIEIHTKFCKAVSEGKEIKVVFLDISKAFDRVWHKGLLEKLSKFGIRGSLLDWFTSYLRDRIQRVIINGQCSEWTSIKAGVPQGSVLGPLLFLVYINDIVNVVKNCNIRLFADDTCLFIEIDNKDTAEELVNEDLNHIHVWANNWRTQNKNTYYVY
jgi:hypothetical protein